VSVAPPLARIAVGVVVERRKATSPWIDFTWCPVAVLAGRPEAAPWSVLSVEGETTTFYAGASDVDLYRTETGSYRDNLASGRPSLWVALRPSGTEPPYGIVAVTADPAEGESFTQAGDDVVATVPMPPPVHDMIDAFVAEHHVERAFSKRKRDRADPEALARGEAVRKERDE
jgi:Protein of unknown function (DUF3305)